MRPPPLLFKLLIYNTLTRKGFDPSTQIITQNFTTNWLPVIKILIQTLKDDNMFGFFFQRVGRDQGSIPFWVIYFIIFCVHLPSTLLKSEAHHCFINQL